MNVRYLDTDEVISIALQAIISTGDRPQGFRDRGLLESRWESDPPAGRPPRHLYRLTAAGLRMAAQIAAAPVPYPYRRTWPELGSV